MPEGQEQPTIDQDKKYDRQLRLWGAQGQKALSESKILLINAGPTGTETMKNLVLPGCGHFVVLDNEIVSEKDLSNNFFVDAKSLGQSRAKTTWNLLLEMNPDCKGDFRVANPIDIIDNEPKYFNDFTLIIATQMEPESLSKLAHLCYVGNIPLVICRSYGFLGYVRVQIKEHTIVESRIERDLIDLRIANPFKELDDWANSIDLANLNSRLHGHVPFPVLLIKAKKTWLQQNSNEIPKTSKEKKAFKELIESMALNFWMEDNFQEAIKYYFKAYTIQDMKHSNANDLKNILQDNQAKNISPNSANFWILVAALNQFIIDRNDSLPVSGVLPDMTATSEWYKTMQDIYSNKANEDLSYMVKLVGNILSTIGRKKNDILFEDIKTFCKNVFAIRVFRTKSLNEELDMNTFNKNCIKEPIDEAQWDPTVVPELLPGTWYLALRACDEFYKKNGKYPGEHTDKMEHDALRLWEEMQLLKKDLGEDAGNLSCLTEKHAAEMTRYYASELHNIAAFVGGVASQEAVKLITHQYNPVQHTYIYNGISSMGASFNF